MTDVRPGGNRRIDRVLGPTYLDGLPELPIQAVRAKRREAEQEEADLSYLRRLLHARIDIVRAEQARRDGTAGADAAGVPVDGSAARESLLGELPRILSQPQRGGRPFARPRPPSGSAPRTGRHRRRVERLVANVDLSDVTARTDDELARVLRTYQDEERQVSEVRARVQGVIDRCGTELTRRYASGEAAVAELIEHDLADSHRRRPGAADAGDRA
jgi:hypothetical protein